MLAAIKVRQIPEKFFIFNMSIYKSTPSPTTTQSCKIHFHENFAINFKLESSLFKLHRWLLLVSFSVDVWWKIQAVWGACGANVMAMMIKVEAFCVDIKHKILV